MGREPSCDEANNLKKGPWTPEEDFKLIQYIEKHGHGKWKILPKFAGLNRCGKSCRLRWTNYLRPDIKRGKFSPEEEQIILHFHSIHGNKWSTIASHLSGRTDNEIKNFWNTHLKKKLIQMGFDPTTHRPRTDLLAALRQLNASLMKMEPIAGGCPAMGDRPLHIAKLQNFLYLLHPTDAVNSVNPCFDAEHLGAISKSSSSKETLHFPVSLEANIGTSDCFINFGSGQDETSPFWCDQLLDEPFGV